MFIHPGSLSIGVLILGWVVFSIFFAYALVTTPRKAHIEASTLKILPAFIVCLMLLWILKAGLLKGLEIHVLGITSLTLVFGTRLAILGLTGLYCLLAVSGKVSWVTLGWNAVLVGFLQVMLAAGMHRFIYRKLPRNFFVFVFLSSFLNGALVMAFTILLLSGFLWLVSAYPANTIQTQFLQLTPLLLFPEAFLNGGLMAIMVIYRPEWVSGFNQQQYLSN